MKEKKRIPIIIYYIIIVLAIVIFSSVILPKMTEPTYKEITYKEFIDMLNNGEIEKVELTNQQINIKPAAFDEKNPVYYKTGMLLGVADDNLITLLLEKNVDFSSPIQRSATWFEVLLSYILPVLFITVVFFVIMRMMSKKMGSGVMSFGKNTSKIYAEQSTGKSFADVAKLADAQDSGSCGRPCRFKSCHPHQNIQGFAKIFANPCFFVLLYV